jgi:outer membrane protein TolC
MSTGRSWKKIILIILSTTFVSSKVFSREVTLQESFRLAVVKSASVAISQSQIDQADAKIQQARAGYFPALSLQAKLTEQQTTENFTNNGLAENSQSSVSLNLNQNIFQGFRDLNTINQKNHLKEAFEWSKKLALQQLYKDVAQAFYNLLIFQSDLLLYQEQIQSVVKRKSELLAAKKSGRARDSDILIADSVVASLQATVLKIQSQMISFKEAFTFLTGLQGEVKLVDNFILPYKSKDLILWVARKDERYDVQQSKNVVLAAEDAVAVAKSSYFPSLSLNANYYLARSNEFYKDIDWDASLVLNFPLFAGGLNKAQVNEAKLLHQAEKNKMQLTEELALQNIKSMAATAEANFKLLDQIQKAFDLNYRSYELVRRDNRLGVATNADVLAALQVWQEAKRNLERLRLTVTYDYIKLLVESSNRDIESEINSEAQFKE